ncbi:MAG: septal ring lytic transglycosylase RlpA family protein, partial [Pseudomonadota bacterium]
KRMALVVGALALAFMSPILAPSAAKAAQFGVASYYWQPQPLASGGRFNPNAMSAAHKTLPFGTKVRVTRISTGRSVVVTINDRGPYIKGRIIDLSRAAAQKIGMTGAGVTRVKVDVVGRGGVAHLALGGNGGQYAGAARYGKKSSSRKVASAKSAKRRSAKATKRKGKRSAGKKFVGIPKSLRGKKIISVKRRYAMGGKIRTTSGRVPKGGRLISETITYTN